MLRSIATLIMQTLRFAVLPYRDYKGDINPDYIYLALVDEQDKWVERDSITSYAWRNNGSDFRNFLKNSLITRIYRKLKNYSDDWHAEYSIDDAIYHDWYRWYFFIDGEPACEFIVACGHSQYSNNFQSNIAVTEGWKYFKALRKTGFNTSTAAILAYSRGYIDGMNYGFTRDGDEALACLGLRKA